MGKYVAENRNKFELWDFVAVGCLSILLCMFTWYCKDLVASWIRALAEGFGYLVFWFVVTAIFVTKVQARERKR